MPSSGATLLGISYDEVMSPQVPRRKHVLKTGVPRCIGRSVLAAGPSVGWQPRTALATTHCPCSQQQIQKNTLTSVDPWLCATATSGRLLGSVYLTGPLGPSFVSEWGTVLCPAHLSFCITLGTHLIVIGGVGKALAAPCPRARRSNARKNGTFFFGI